jgi:gliding motility-associated protein GldM
MSIPKEPRQLMINIMYLVLTALLALNVSAEIFNAFDMVNDGLKTANKTLDTSNDALPQVIKDGSKKKDELKKYADRVDVVRGLSKEGSDYINGIINKLIDEGGNRNGSVDDDDYVTLKNGEKELKGKKNYDVTTRMMVNDGEGEKLKAKLLDIRAKMLKLVDNGDKVALPINIDDEKWKNPVSPKKASWSDFTFGHMPTGATMPIFTKYINDLKSSESAILNYLAGKVGTTTEVVFDKYRVVSAPKKTYITRGETFEAEIFLSAASGTTNTGISVNVGGSSLPTNSDGIAIYKAAGNTLGKKSYTATITVTNPVTNVRTPYNSTFEYEVGEKSVTVSASKMNVFYLGVPNPVEVSAAGVNSNNIKVSIDNGSIERGGDGVYIVTAGRPGPANVTVTADGKSTTKAFRVKPIPTPIPKFTPDIAGGSMGDGQFKAFKRLIAHLENFDFDARCEVVEFTLMRLNRREDPVIVQNPGSAYTEKVSSMVNKAAPGDNYLFREIKAKCPGDLASRKLPDLIVNIR